MLDKNNDAPAVEKELVISELQRSLFLELRQAIQTLNERLTIVFSTMLAGHGFANGQFVRFAEKDGVFTMIVNVPKE